MPKSIQIAFDILPTDYDKDEEWMANDWMVDDLGKFRCNIVLNTNSVVEYTVNSGTNWIKINTGGNLIQNCAYGFDIYVRAGDRLNFRSPSEGTTTVILGRCDSIKDEG
jgi:hypothetical protein